MAEIVQERPAEKVVVDREREHYHEGRHSNAGLIVAIIIVVLLLLVIFGRGLLGGSSGNGGSTDVNVTPSSSTGQ